VPSVTATRTDVVVLMPQLCACVYAVLVRCCSSFVTVSVGTCRQSVTDDRSAVAVRASCQPVHCRCDRRSVGPILSTGLGASIPWSSIACVAGCILSCHQSLKGTSVVKYVESFYSPPSCFFFFSQDRVYLAACIKKKKKIHQHACAFSCIFPPCFGFRLHVHPARSNEMLASRIQTQPTRIFWAPISSRNAREATARQL
jgi:hypothetical protein